MPIIRGNKKKPEEEVLVSVCGSVKKLVRKKIIQEAARKDTNMATLVGEVLTSWAEDIDVIDDDEEITLS